MKYQPEPQGKIDVSRPGCIHNTSLKFQGAGTLLEIEGDQLSDPSFFSVVGNKSFQVSLIKCSEMTVSELNLHIHIYNL